MAKERKKKQKDVIRKNLLNKTLENQSRIEKSNVEKPEVNTALLESNMKSPLYRGVSLDTATPTLLEKLNSSNL